MHLTCINAIICLGGFVKKSPIWNCLWTNMFSMVMTLKGNYAFYYNSYIVNLLSLTCLTIQIIYGGLMQYNIYFCCRYWFWKYCINCRYFSYESMKSVCDRYNRALDSLLNLVLSFACFCVKFKLKLQHSYCWTDKQTAHWLYNG